MQGWFSIPVGDIINRALEKGLILINAGTNIIRFLFRPWSSQRKMWMKCLLSSQNAWMRKRHPEKRRNCMKLWKRILAVAVVAVAAGVLLYFGIGSNRLASLEVIPDNA